MAYQIKSSPGGLPVSHFVESKDCVEIEEELKIRKTKVILVFGKSGQGKTQIGNHLMDEWSGNEVGLVFFFQTRNQDSYKVSFTNVLQINNWDQDRERPRDFDFVKLCEFISGKMGKERRQRVLFHFDDLQMFDETESNVTKDIGQWVEKLYEMILRFSKSKQLPDMQLLITVPEKPDSEKLSVKEKFVYMHTMTGFQAEDVIQFFTKSFDRATPPTFLLERVDEIVKKMGNSPQLYKAKLERFQRMETERGFNAFLGELDDQPGQKVNKHTTAIKQRLRYLHHLEIWKVMTNFDRINVPSDLFYAVLVYCCEAGKFKLSRKDNHLEIFSEMASEYLRSEFVTEHREGTRNQKVHWTIHTEVHNCLKELVKEDKEEEIGEQRDYLIVGLMAMASIVDRDDRFHSDKREYTSRHVNMLLQAKALYNQIRIAQTTGLELSDYEKLAVYQVLTGIHYAMLKKIGSDLNQTDLEQFYREIKNLETQLTTQAVPVGGGDEAPSLVSDSATVLETISHYQQMRGYLREDSNKECDIALRLYRFSERDENIFKKYLDDRGVPVKFRPDPQHYGMFTQNELVELRRANLVLEPHIYRQVYPLEVLASMYIVLGMMREHVTDVGDSMEFWTRTPFVIFRRVTDDIFKVIEETASRKEFMQKVIIERDRVLQKQENLAHMNFEQIKQQYERLKELKDAYEYGFLRSNLKEDSYHHLNCSEGLLETIGSLILSWNAGTDQPGQILRYVDEGLNHCQNIRELIVDQRGDSTDKNAWRQYAYGMEYQAKFMFSCRQTSLGYRFYTYALYSFFKYTGEGKKEGSMEKCVDESKFIKMCKAIVERNSCDPLPPFTPDINRSVGEKIQQDLCVCLYKIPNRCICNNLYYAFLRNHEESSIAQSNVKKAVKILVDKLSPSTVATAPEEEP